MSESRFYPDLRPCLAAPATLTWASAKGTWMANAGVHDDPRGVACPGLCEPDRLNAWGEGVESQRCLVRRAMGVLRNLNAGSVGEETESGS